MVDALVTRAGAAKAGPVNAASSRVTIDKIKILFVFMIFSIFLLI
jgi:hypothetical protein